MSVTTLPADSAVIGAPVRITLRVSNVGSVATGDEVSVSSTSFIDHVSRPYDATCDIFISLPEPSRLGGEQPYGISIDSDPLLPGETYDCHFSVRPLFVGTTSIAVRVSEANAVDPNPSDNDSEASFVISQGFPSAQAVPALSPPALIALLITMLLAGCFAFRSILAREN